MKRFALALTGLVAGCSTSVPDDVHVSVIDEAVLQAPPVDAIPAPGDYDGDGCLDIGLKGSNGIWYIDYCANGLGLGSTNGGRWDAAFANYGDNTAIPVPADYDGDGLTDIAVKDSSGMWAIDYAANKFGLWDVQVFGYGFANAVPVPADYDGDGKADLAIKDSTGFWGIDYTAGGYNGWDVQRTGYGGANAVPVPADYDGDGHCSLSTTIACSLSSQCPSGEKCFGKADLATKDDAGTWSIDFSGNGFGKPCFLRACIRPIWDNQYGGYGDATAVPVPADYNHDGHADLSVKNSAGVWYVDYYSPTAPYFGAWDPPYGWTSRGGSWSTAVPGDYTPDGNLGLDLAVKDTSGYWYIDKLSNGFSTWDVTINNSARPVAYPPGSPYIVSTRLYDSRGVEALPANGKTQLVTGVKYTVVVSLAPNNGLYTADVQINAALDTPNELVPLNIINSNGSPGAITQQPNHAPPARRFALTCTQPGSYRLGFELRDTDPAHGGTGAVFNSDYGIVVQCLGPGYLYGRVTARACLPSGTTCGQGLAIGSGGGRYVENASGMGLANIPVTIAGVTTVNTDASGYWSANVPTGTPLRVSVAPSGYSPAEAVNVVVPAGSSGGMELDMSVEEPFWWLTANGLAYKTYYDYAHGRSLIHVVTMNESISGLRTERVWPGTGGLATLLDIANQLGANVPLIMNGGFFDVSNTCTGWTGQSDPVGYFYSADNGGYVHSFVPDGCNGRGIPGQCIGTNGNPIEDYGYAPLLHIVGTGANQSITIKHNASMDFLTASSTWKEVPTPIWDENPPYNVSDPTYAMQAWPVLVRANVPLAANGCGDGDPAFARTAIGVSASNAFVVVVDGEGVNGHGGMPASQLAAFFANILGATDAVSFDSGQSTELVLFGATGPRHVNTMTSENAGWDIDLFNEQLPEQTNGVGSVGNYVRASP